MNSFEKTVSLLSPHIVVGLRSTRLDHRESAILQQYHPAGVIIFARNVENSSGLKALTAEIYSIYEKAGALPPLIMADHEGGRTSVLARAIGTPPSQMAAAMSRRAGAAGELFRETAERMLTCGVNMSLGPVADINSEYLNPVIGTRAFGMSEDLVSGMVSEAVEAMKSTGILTSIKHFPGHGSTAGDSHVELPVTAKNIGQLRIKDLRPFESGISAGADSVMTAHIAPVDRMVPSSLDGTVIRGILREELGYDGVVLTDGLEMAGILTGSGLSGAAAGAVREAAGAAGGLFSERTEEPRDGMRARLLRPACVMRTALEAGNDLLLFTRPAEDVFSEIEAVLPLLPADLPFWEEQFPDISGPSTRRIDRLRKRAPKAYGRHDRTSGIYDLVGSMAVSCRHFEGENENAWSPCAARVVFCGERADFSYYPVVSFIEAFLEGLGAEESSRRFDPDRLKFLRAAASPSSKEKIELLSFISEPSSPAATPKGMEGHAEIAQIVVLLGRRPVSPEDIAALTGSARAVVAAEWPWASQCVPAGRQVVVTYGVCDSSAREAAAVLLGKDKSGAAEFN